MSGFIFDDVYLTDDTVWCAEVESALGWNELATPDTRAA